MTTGKRVVLKDRFFAPRQSRNITAANSRHAQALRGNRPHRRLQTEMDARLRTSGAHVFWDSDVAKVMEGMACAAHASPEIAARLEPLVDLVISAQQPDGYLNTHFTVTDTDKR